MRIVGNIPHAVLKITIFLHDSKYALKFESGLYEMTYKIRQGDEIDSVETIKNIVDTEFINEVLENLPKMHQTKLNAIGRWVKEKESNEFDEII